MEIVVVISIWNSEIVYQHFYCRHCWYESYTRRSTGTSPRERLLAQVRPGLRSEVRAVGGSYDRFMSFHMIMISYDFHDISPRLLEFSQHILQLSWDYRLMASDLLRFWKAAWFHMNCPKSVFPQQNRRMWRADIVLFFPRSTAGMCKTLVLQETQQIRKVK